MVSPPFHPLPTTPPPNPVPARLFLHPSRHHVPSPFLPLFPIRHPVPFPFRPPVPPTTRVPPPLHPLPFPFSLPHPRRRGAVYSSPTHSNWSLFLVI